MSAEHKMCDAFLKQDYWPYGRSSVRCLKKAWKDGKCKRHHPEEIKRRQKQRDEVNRAIAIRDNYPEAPAASPVSDAVELVEYTKWVRENWIVGSNETWRRKADYRDKRTDNALVTEYKLSSTITKKQ